MKLLRLTILLGMLLSMLPLKAQDADSTMMQPHKRRPKVAVVLAGGGAKGVAHIPVLKAIEDAGIPVDLVVGTSMGSIIGGLYSTGYSPDTLRHIIQHTDWIKLIMESPTGNTLSSKMANENYMLRFVINKERWKSGTGKGGVLQGRSITNYFRTMTRFLPDTLNFSDMPIPYACVATDVVTGERTVFTRGNLPICMRASMAIPSAFTPVTIDSVLYVDGGVSDNFPVDVAREMGADIVIGVDLKVKTSVEQLANSAFDLLLNCVDLYSRDVYQHNIEDADIYIPIDVTGYTSASFTPTALDTLISRGDHYAELARPQLDSLRQTLNLDEEPIRIRVGDYSFAKVNESERRLVLFEEQSSINSLSDANGGSLNSTLNIGARFDNKEYATLQVNSSMVLSQRSASLLKLEGRLGQRMQFNADISRRTFGSQRMGFNYKFQKHDLEMYQQGTKVFDTDLRYNKFDLYFTQEGRSLRYTFGVNYNIFHFADMLNLTNIGTTKKHDTDRFFSYYIKGEVNTLDYQYFQTRGHRLEVRADLITDNLLTFQNKAIFPILSVMWDCSFRCSERFCLQPRLYARILVSEDITEPMAVKNVIGGMFNEQYLPQQKSTAGLTDLELIQEDGLGILGLMTQYSPFQNHYILLTGDVFTHTNHIQNALDRESINYGIAASYNVRTPIGPVGIKASWSDWDKGFKVTINAGYYF